MSGTRLDIVMVERGLVESREKARALIMSGAVTVDAKTITKPGTFISDSSDLNISIREELPFVSRGGFKLQKALDTFPIDVTNKIALDVGASTGGFTDCLLQHNAEKVYSVDVGYGQLAWKLRNDSRVVVMERHNARYMEPAWFEVKPNFACMDVAFISIRLLLPAIYRCLEAGSHVVTLIKPQFEAGRNQVGKNGVVHDINVHKEVSLQLLNFALSNGFDVLGFTYSPIVGPKGNIEFLAWLQTSLDATGKPAIDIDAEVDKIVTLAHNANLR